MIALAGIIGWFNPKRLLMLGGAIVLTIGMVKVVNFVDAKYELEKEVFRQEIVIEQKDIEINGLKIERDLAQEATLLAEENLDAERARGIALEAARQRALQVTPEDNGEVAPVLLDALDTIRERAPQ